jgi:hypothetical protein
MKRVISLTILACALIAGFAIASASASGATAAIAGCRVTNPDGADATVVRTGAAVHLAKGSVLTLINGQMHQGFIAVSALVGGKSQRLAIQADDTNCIR